MGTGELGTNWRITSKIKTHDPMTQNPIIHTNTRGGGCPGCLLFEKSVNTNSRSNKVQELMVIAS
jgi:hypothetical protein